MRFLNELVFQKCPEVKTEINKWKNLFLDVYSAYEYFNQYDDNGLKEPIYKIDKKRYLDVVRNTISDVILMIIRYGVINSSCDNFQGINKNKFLGSFIFHFTRILPAKNADRKINVYILIFMLSFVKDENNRFDCGMSDKLKKEFFFFLTHRQTSSEFIYMFLQALCHHNRGTEIKIVHQNK